MRTSKPNKPLGLKPFLERLDSLLDDLSHSELKILLREQARTLRPSERIPFLARFKKPTATKPAKKKRKHIDDQLLGDVYKFIDDTKSGMYYDGWGYDHEIGDERAFGDESWVDEMDALFDRAEAEFFDGNIENAGAAYGALLESFGLNEEGCAFSGQEPPEEMIAADVDEAKARYFRCLYENSPPEERVPRLAHAVEVLEYTGSRQIGVQAMCDASPQPLPDLNIFMTEWIATLKTVPDDCSFGWGQSAKWLLREAVRLVDGVQGLAALAHEEGDRHPDAFMDWVSALVEEKQFDKAIEAAQQGVKRIVHPEAKAEMADQLAELAADRNKPDLEVYARRAAWRSDPKMLRLLLLLNAGDIDAGERGRCIDAELASLAEFHPKLSPRLAALLEICAGRYLDGMERLKKSKTLGWSSESHVGPLVLPFALLASMHTRDWQSVPVLASYIRSVEELTEDGLISLHELKLLTTHRESVSVLDLLTEALSLHPLSREDDKWFLSAVRDVVCKRVRAIVSNCHRRAYERAATLAVAVSEAERRVFGRSTEKLLAGEVYAEFSRHSAFRRELTALMPGLADAPKKKPELRLLRGGSGRKSQR